MVEVIQNFLNPLTVLLILLFAGLGLVRKSRDRQWIKMKWSHLLKDDWDSEDNSMFPPIK